MLAFTFPGQGSQHAGMGEPWVDHPSWALVGAASEASGRDVAALLLAAGADELRRTENAQLSTYVLSLVIHDAVHRLGLRSAMAAGHSLGEYSALTAAGAIGLEDGVRLVTERGAGMQAAADARAGTMAAVLGADEIVVAEACAKADGDVWVANSNAVGQAVIAGDPDAVAEAGEIARQLGARKVLPLTVGGAFHTPFMAPAAARLRAALAATAFADAEVPVVANVDALAHRQADDWPDLLITQLTTPVRWRQSVERMVADGVTTFLELGPGTVLTGLAKRGAPGATARGLARPDELEAMLDELSPYVEEPDGGEQLFVAERLVVSPAAGVYVPADDVAEGQHIEPGRIVGRVGGEPVRSPFRGTVRGLLATAGERLSRSQPVAWLRTA